MARKLSQKELKQRIKGLEKESFESHKIQRELIRIKRAIETTDDAIGVTDSKGSPIYHNKALTDLFGYTAKELKETGGPSILYERQHVAEEVFESIVNGKSWNGEIDMVSRSGRKVPVSLHADAIVDDAGKFIGVIGVHRDISELKEKEDSLRKVHDELERRVEERTIELSKSIEQLILEIKEKKLAEEAMKVSEEKYRSLYETSKDAIMTLVPPDWKFTSGNQATINIFMTKDEQDFISKSPMELSPKYQPDGQLSSDKAKKMIEKAMSTGSNFFEWTHKKLNGEEFPATVLLSRIELEGKQFLQAVVRNITELKQSEEIIHNLSHQLITSQESERQRISYELHDSIAQDISSSKIICETFLNDNTLKPESRKQISLISVSLHKTLEIVRNLSYELRPPGLEELGLTDPMYYLCEDFSEKTGVKIDFQSAGIDKLNLSYNTKINLYRLLQEALNNVRKHSDASNVKVRLISSFPNVILRIYDDGKGFDLKERLAKTSREKRMGLSSMEARVAILLGRIDIESRLGKGTKIAIKIPQEDANIGA